MYNEYLPFASEELQYFSIPFTCIDKLILDEFEAYILLWKYNQKFNEIISHEEK